MVKAGEGLVLDIQMSGISCRFTARLHVASLRRTVRRGRQLPVGKISQTSRRRREILNFGQRHLSDSYVPVAL